MMISVTGHHIDVTESLKGYVNAKFKKILMANRFSK